MKKSTILIKYHKGGTIWSRGEVIGSTPEGYWEWYRIDGSKKRSGYFTNGEPTGEWITYDQEGKIYKKTTKKLQ